MTLEIKGTRVFTNNGFEEKTLMASDGRIIPFSENASVSASYDFSFSSCILIPGLTDVHVHFREPGFSYKETILSGSRAALAGGYTAVCTMPNLSPAPDSDEGLRAQEERIAEDGLLRIYPYGTITKGSRGEELSDMDVLAPRVIAFSDDGRGVQDDGMMEKAMREAKRLGRMIVSHCEDDRLVGGCLHDGAYARAHGYRGIPSECEWRMVERDLRLAAKTGVPYHVCHVSAAESVALIREAKRAGIDVTAETAPHYLILTEDDIREEHARYKMNPPLRALRDREALVEGLLDGTLDMIATDHAPHGTEEKSQGFVKSPMGVVGLETAFSAMYTYLVRRGILSLEKLVDVMALAPRRRFGIVGGTEIGDVADFAVFDLEKKYICRGEDFVSMGKMTPFEGMEMQGKCALTAIGGEVRYCAERS